MPEGAGRTPKPCCDILPLHIASTSMTLTEPKYIVAVACEGRKRGPAEGGDRSPQLAVGGGDAIRHAGAEA